MSTVNARLPRLARLIDDADVVCPAGCAARAGTGVMCRVEGDVIDARANPTSVARFCLGDNRTCPSWQAEKEAHWAEQRSALEAMR